MDALCSAYVAVMRHTVQRDEVHLANEPGTQPANAVRRGLQAPRAQVAGS